MAFLDDVERLLSRALAAAPRGGAGEVTVAVGCTGGRHRSIVLAAELGRRLAADGELEISVDARDLEPAPR
jgi:UPF0042 nucleotide-binding protein